MRLKPLLLLSLGLALPSLVVAQVTSTWDGGSGDWTDGANWSDGVPGAIDTALIGTDQGSVPDPLVEIDIDDTEISLGNLDFQRGLNHLISGGDILLTDGGRVFYDGEGFPSLANPVAVTIGSNIFLQPASATEAGSHTFSWSANNTRGLVYNGDIVAGETSHADGVNLLITASSVAVGTPPQTFNGSLLDNPTDGALAVTVEGPTRVFLNSADNDFSGGFTLNGGASLSFVNGGLGDGDITFNEGLIFVDDQTLRTLTNTVYWNGTLTVDRSNLVFNGDVILGENAAFSAAGGLGGRPQAFNGNILDGTGTDPFFWDGQGAGAYTGTFSADNSATFSRGIFLESGAIVAGHNDAFGTGTIEIQNGSVYTTSAAITISNDLILNGQMTFGAAVTQNPNFGGDLTVGSDAALDPLMRSVVGRTITFSGELLNGGHDKALTLAVGAPTSGMTYAFTGSSPDYTGGFIIDDQEEGRRITLAIAQSDSLGTGKLSINRDTFTLSRSGSASSLNLSNAIDLNGSITLGSFAGWEFSGPVAFSTADDETVGIEFAGASNVAVFSGVVTDADNVTFVKTGAGTLAFSNNSNAIDGTLQVDGGAIQIGAGGASGQLGSATVQLASGTSLIFNRSDAFTVANEVSGAGGLIARGGDAELTGTLSFTGNSTVENGGTLRINTTYDEGSTFNVQSGGTFGGTGTVGGTETPTIDLAAGAFLSPGAATTPGTLTLGGSTTLDLTNIEGTGTGALIFRLGSVSDQVDGGFITWTQNLLGFTDFTFDPVAGFGGGTYILFDNISTFPGASLDDNNLTGMIGGLESTLSLNGSTLSLTVVPEPATVAALLGALALGLAFWRRTRAGARVMTNS